jgi:hypothetical protein
MSSDPTRSRDQRDHDIDETERSTDFGEGTRGDAPNPARPRFASAAGGSAGLEPGPGKD